jgi:hypothetical protein
MSTRSRNACRRKCKPEFGGKRGSGEYFLQRQLSIYRGEWGQFREHASIRPLRGLRRTRVYSDVLRVTFFTEILRFSWNRIVGVNSLPRGASVGEFRKTCHLRNVKVYEIREMSFQEHRIHEDLESRICEALKSRTCEDLESRTCKALKP